MNLNDRAQEEQVERNSRSKVLIIVLALLFVALTSRLFQLQILEYDQNHSDSESNRLMKEITKPERGGILDKFGNVLVRNRPSYQINIIYDKINDKAKLRTELLSIVDSLNLPVFDSTVIDQRFKEGVWRKYQKLRIYEDAPIELVSIVEEHIHNFPGVVTTVESRRSYPHGTALAHTLGYTGELDRHALKKEEFKDYQLGDRVGKKGLEDQYEDYFKGKHGIRYIETNARGKRLGTLQGMPFEKPIPGNTVYTTLDLELQKVAEEAFPDSVKGGLVVINPKNGEILAMLSSPRINPNIFSLEKNALKKEWASVALDSMAPLNNRTVVGRYPPGSLFKFFTAIAGVEDDIVTPTAIPYDPCRGGWQFGRRYQRCWKPSGHGHMHAIDALRESCDVYFYQLGLELGMPKINKVAEMYGLGQKTQVDLPIEKRGLLMDSVVYNKRFKRLNWKWTRGQILNLSIGQGQLVTPIQMANSYAGLANGKVLWRPHLVKKIVNELDSVVYEAVPDTLRKITLRPKTQEMVIQALEEVVVAPGGTGRTARVEGVRVGGKTGSAENPHGEFTHAWFGGVAPLDDPEIAVAVVMENVGHGGSWAGPVAGKILRYYFARKNERK
jgi:penicillin-binding protein 2